MSESEAKSKEGKFSLTPELYRFFFPPITRDIPLKQCRIVGDPLSRAGIALNTGLLTDIALLVGETKVETFHAHKLFLSLHSPCFREMFRGSCAGLTEVRIKDVDPDSFRIFLQFIYCGLFPNIIPLELSINILQCARKFGVPKLEELTVAHFKKLAGAENVIQLLETSLSFKLQDLENSCLTFIDTNTQAVVAHKNFPQASVQAIRKILERDTLNTTESMLFESVKRWAQAECTRNCLIHTAGNLRSVIGEHNLKLLRFATMTATEFADGPGKSGLLTAAETGTVLMKICSSSGPESTDFSLNEFSGVKRGSKRPGLSMWCRCTEYQYNCLFCTPLPRNISPLGKMPTSTGTLSKSLSLLSNRIPKFYSCECQAKGKCCRQQ